jgi:S1-C subfamily serine protease
MGHEHKTAWLSLAVACCLVVGAAALLFLFFKERDVIPSESFFSRLSTLSTWAAAVGIVAVLVSVSSYLYARRREWTKKVVLRYSGLAVILLSVGISATALFFRSKTGRIPALPHLAPAHADPTLQRLHSATAAIHVFNKAENPYRTVEGMGVIIAAKSDRIWVLTVPYSDKSSWQNLPNSDAIWVSFADGRSLRGRVRWAAPSHINLAVIEVEGQAPPSLVSIYPIPEGVIPGAQVLSVPNPLRPGWLLKRGQVLTRRSLRTKLARHCFVQTDLDTNPEDIGSGLYSSDGRLMGLYAGLDLHGQTAQSQYVIVTSEIMRVILAAVESGNFDSLQALSFEVISS